jgi:acyl-CoA dehydrogenase
MLAPSETRSRLCHGIYTSARAGHPVGTMEQALPQIIQAEPLERKLIKAIKAGQAPGMTWEAQLQSAVEAGALTPAEADMLITARDLTAEIIAVDDFDPDELKLGKQSAATVGKQHAA